jgi:membrane-associated phospholipid phosphatase
MLKDYISPEGHISRKVRRYSPRRISKHLVSKKILSIILDDFSFFGSLPFYGLVTLVTYFVNPQLFMRLIYCFIVSIIVVLTVKSVHYKDRPQKQEFTMFMERVVASSFPSTHSMNITILAILIMLAYPLLWVKATSIAVALLVFAQRYITKKHFFTDILGGILIGVAEVIFVIKIL